MDAQIIIDVPLPTIWFLFYKKSYQIVIGRAVYTLGHVKDVVDVFNDVQKQYLDTCLRMRSMPEVDKVDGKCMRADAMTKKGEVSFAEECNRLLYIRYEIGTKSDKKHAKQESKACLNTT